MYVHQLCEYFLGNAIRYCDGNKVWSRTNALSCASAEFVNLLEEVMLVVNNKNIMAVKLTVRICEIQPALSLSQITNIMSCYLN